MKKIAADKNYRMFKRAQPESQAEKEGISSGFNAGPNQPNWAVSIPGKAGELGPRELLDAIKLALGSIDGEDNASSIYELREKSPHEVKFWARLGPEGERLPSHRTIVEKNEDAEARGEAPPRKAHGTTYHLFGRAFVRLREVELNMRIVDAENARIASARGNAHSVGSFTIKADPDRAKFNEEVRKLTEIVVGQVFVDFWENTRYKRTRKMAAYNI